jgi:two-component system cell cycle sensor histidine kinase/response regulator CckA
MFKSKSNKSIIRIFLLSLLFISFMSTAVIGYLWVSNEFQRFEEDSETMRREYIDSQKALIKDEIEKVIDYIQYSRSKTDELLRQLLKERVYEAHSIATNLYRKYYSVKNERELKRLIKEALRPIRFSKGRGYFYIHRMDGVLELYPVKPHTEGENQFDLQDKHGIYVVREEIRKLKEQQEGFLEYSWKNSSGKDYVEYSKVSFVKYFKPFNWYIGSKEYREDFLQGIQLDILKRIGKIRFGNYGYIFVTDFDGITLWNETRRDLIGKRIWTTESPDGEGAVKRAREEAVKPTGGFIEYKWNNPASNRLETKISFVKAIPDWEWIIGTGVYKNEVEGVITQKRQELQAHVNQQVLKIIGIFLLIFFVVIVITLLFSKRLRKEFDVFLSFFRRAAVSHEKIDSSKLFAEEFKMLGDSANQMLEEQQAVEKSLRESEERLAVTFRSIAEGVITTDTGYNVVLINRAAEELTGWGQEDARGKSLPRIFQIVDEKTNVPVQHPVMMAVEQNKVIGLAGPVVLVARDGTRRLISHSAAPIQDKDGDIIGAVMAFQDITEKRKMEEELQKAQKLESLGMLAGGIAHDFNNMLTGVLGNIDVAKSRLKPGHKVYKQLSLAEAAVIKTRQLTNQLLTFASGGEPVKKVHAAAELIEESVVFALRGSNVKCEFQLPRDVSPLEVDRNQMNQALNNLVLNAIQAMPDGGILNVSAVNVSSGANTGLPLEDKRYVKIAIRDTGAGIPRKLIKKIFDPYFTTKPEGSGLGLTSAYSIVKKHEGYIDVASRVGKGSTFTIYIPASDKDITEPALDKKFIVDSKAKKEFIKVAGRVLVMDDDEIVGEVASSMLQEMGYHPEIALDGNEAIKLYNNNLETGHPFDVVLMDLTIPGGMGGSETIKKLLEIDPDIKAIVSSGYSNDPIMANFKEYGFQGCLAKPYKMQDLNQILQQVLSSK